MYVTVCEGEILGVSQYEQKSSEIPGEWDKFKCVINSALD